MADGKRAVVCGPFCHLSSAICHSPSGLWIDRPQPAGGPMIASISLRESSALAVRERPSPALAVHPASVSALLLCSATFAGWGLAVAGSISPSGLVFLLFMPVTVFLVGRAVLNAARVGGGLAREFPMVFLVGAAVSALTLMVLRIALPIDL